MGVLPITSFYAAVLAIMMVVLSVNVSLRRRALGFGDGGDNTLKRRIRAHGNFIEYAPFGLVLVLVVELAGPAHVWTWTLGGLLVASRLAHAAGLLYTSTPVLRAPAMVVQHLSFLAAAAWLLRHAL